jgi:hypothetical protein
MANKKFDIVACTIDEDQVAVANQWANTFIYNSKSDIAANMSQLLLACLAQGDFRVRSYLSKSSELQAPSDQLNIVDYLSHASRIVLDYDELTGENREELLKFFPAPATENTVFSRSATHNVRRNDEHIVEGKGILLGVIGQLPGLIKTPQDFGVNIAMGGDGQENFYGKKITANGYSGHFYFHRNDSENLLMLGLEQSAPASSPLEFLWGKKKSPDDVQQNHDQFDQGHSLVGASDIYTAAGSLYFSDPVYQAKLLLEKGVFPPDKYGAMQVKINNENWPAIKKFLEELSDKSNEVNKDELLGLLQKKPKTKTSAKEEYLSYIALDFDSYLKRVYQLFIGESELDSDHQTIILESQSKLLSTIKMLQQGTIDHYESFKLQSTAITEKDDIPVKYKQAITRIQQLFAKQHEIDPKLKQTHQELLLKNQFDDLQEERKIFLEKLLKIQQYFKEHPPTKEQEELQVFLTQIDRQIRELQNPFSSSLSESVDLTSSWVVCEAAVSINVDTIDKLILSIEQAKALTKQCIMSNRSELSFSQTILGWQTKLLPVAQINLIDYTELNLSDLAQQFNKQVDELATQAETLNLWKHESSQTANLLVEYSNKNSALDAGHAFIAQYRESTILRRLFTLDTTDLCTFRFRPYEEPNAQCMKQQPHSYWSKVSSLLTAGSDVIALLRSLKKLQKSKASWEDVSITAGLFQQAVERFKNANEEVTTYLSQISQKPSTQTFESSFFYRITDEMLKEMNGVQLATLCFEELNAKAPSSLIKRITNDEALWQRMEASLQETDFKKRRDNIEQKIVTLGQIRTFWERVHQFKENTALETKERLLGELKKLEHEIPSIFDAAKVIAEAQMECKRHQEFLSLLQNLAVQENQYEILQLLEQRYQSFTVNEQKHYASQLSGARERVFQVYLTKINTSQTIENKKANFQILDQLFAKLSTAPDSQAQFKSEYEVQQKENNLYELHERLGKASSVNEKQLIFNSESFTEIIRNFEGIGNEKSSECAKGVYKQIKRVQVISEKLGFNVNEQESSSKLMDALINQLRAIIPDNIEEDLLNRLIEAIVHDELFKRATLENGTQKMISAALIQDLLSLKEFRDQKIALCEAKKYGSEYEQSINQFYQKSLTIRLSDLPLKKQAEEIINTAGIEFKHRHDGLRMVADVAMIVSAFVGIGVIIGLGRLALGKTLFFSSYLGANKTDRELELKNDWLVKELSDDESMAARLIAAPAA